MSAPGIRPGVSSAGRNLIIRRAGRRSRPSIGGMVMERPAVVAGSKRRKKRGVFEAKYSWIFIEILIGWVVGEDNVKWCYDIKKIF